jgi:NAD(P)-dependent dehydrogenase (short-subunit alcohol dehydrogenase family)
MSTQRVVLITGASSGLGRATAEALAQSGHTVFGTARSPERTQPIPGITLLQLDVTDDASVKRGVQSVLDAAGHIDVLVNNAGYSVLGAFEETSVEQAKALFDTNVFGVMRTIQAALPSMRARGSGMIVNVSSVLGFLPAPYQALYSSTKHALEGLSESLDHEVRQFGIRVMLIEPNWTRTGLGTHAVSAASSMHAYDSERARASAAITASIQAAAEPRVVAQEIARAIGAPYRLRQPVGPGGAKLLSRLRRFMPAGPVDKQLRRNLALDS